MKKGLVWHSRPLDTILAFLGHNVGQIGLDFSNFDPVKTKFQNVMIKSFLVLETIGIVALFGSLGLLI